MTSTFFDETDVNNIDNKYKQSQIDKNTADAQKSEIDNAYKSAVTLAQKDMGYMAAMNDPAKQAAIIDGFYQKLKPQDAVSNNDINQYLNKK